MGSEPPKGKPTDLNETGVHDGRIMVVDALTRIGVEPPIPLRVSTFALTRSET